MTVLSPNDKHGTAPQVSVVIVCMAGKWDNYRWQARRWVWISHEWPGIRARGMGGGVVKAPDTLLTYRQPEHLQPPPRSLSGVRVAWCGICDDEFPVPGGSPNYYLLYSLAYNLTFTAWHKEMLANFAGREAVPREVCISQCRRHLIHRNSLYSCE